MGQALLVTKTVAEDKAIKESLAKDFTSIKFLHRLPGKMETILSEEPEVLILDVEVPGGDALSMVRAMRESGSSLPVLILSAKSALERVGKVTELEPMEYVTKPLDPMDLLLRVRKLLKTRKPVAVRQPVLPKEMVETLLGNVVTELHDPKTGRLSAVRTAGYLGIPVAALAKAMGKGTKAIYKTPTAGSLQGWLAPLEGVIANLLRLFGSKEISLAWLNSAHPRLGNKTPIERIKLGDIGDVAGLVYDLAEGNFS